MPADDVILNLRQIAGYAPAVAPLPTDTLVVQRGGLGGPYMSILANEFVGDVLAAPAAGPLSVGVQAPAGASGAQVFTNAIVGSWGQRFWNACIVNGVAVHLGAGPAAMMQCDPSLGWCWEWDQGGAAGAPVNLQTAMSISSIGYVDVADTVLVGRDPQAPLEVATAQWVQANTVTSFNGRAGQVQLWLQDILKAGGAPIYSPFFMGSPRAFTPSLRSNSTRLATTQFAHAAAENAVNCFVANHPLVFSVNGRSGDVVISTADIDAALAGSPSAFAPLYSPQFSGYPTAPTPPLGTATGEIATTAFVMNAVAASTAGVAAFNGRTGLVTLESADLTGAGGALLAGPVFTGVPSAPTAAPGVSTTQLATCAFVQAAIGALDFALINSPAFTGTPTAPTATPATLASQQIATCAFVQNAIAAAPLVTTFNNRSGAVFLTAADISAAGGLANPSVNLTGNPTSTTPTAGDSSTRIATTAFVANYLPLAGGTLTGAVTATQFNTGNAFLDADGVAWNGAGAVAFVYSPLTGIPSMTGYNNGLSIGHVVLSNGLGSYTEINDIALNGNTSVVLAYYGGSGYVSWPITFSSERRLKRGLRASVRDALAAIMSVPIYECDMTQPVPDAREQHWDWSVVSDELERIIPLAVSPPPDEYGYATIRELPIVVCLMKAVQQLTERLATLEARLA